MTSTTTTSILPEPIKITMDLAQRELTTTHVAGLAHYAAVKLFPFIKPQMPLTFVPEPFNAYDPFAVMVYLNDYKIGYIPAKLSRIFATLRQRGINFAGYVAGINAVKITSTKPYPILMTIYLV